MWQKYKNWRKSVAEKRVAAAESFLRNKKTDLALIDAEYGEVDKTCMNCKAPLQGPFCRACGQRDDDLRRPIWTFLRQLTDALFDADNKVFKTLILLILVPGGLTRAYVSGKRATFTPPLRLYLVISVLFFLFLSATDLVLLDIRFVPKDPAEMQATEQTVTPEEGDATTQPVEGEASPPPEGAVDQLPVEEKTTGEKVVDAGESRIEEVMSKLSPEDRATAEAALEKLGATDLVKVDPLEDSSVNFNNGNLEINGEFPFKPDISMFRKPNLENRHGITKEVLDDIYGSDEPDFLKDIVKGFEKLILNPSASNDLFNDWLPRIMIFVVPIFALFLRMFHWGKQRYYFNQLVFSLHYHTFLFVLMGSLMVIIPQFGSSIGAAVFGWGCLIFALHQKTQPLLNS